VIADLRFAPAGRERVRPARFVPGSSIPVGAACLAASRARECLREILGDPCEIVIGEPHALAPAAWAAIARGARAFVTPGRLTDVVLILPEADARTLVLHAFNERGAIASGPCSALEAQALERIAQRCAPAWEPLCAERRGPTMACAPGAVPLAVAYFDIRVRAPVPLTLGVGIARALPEPGSGSTIPPASLGEVPIAVRAVLGRGTLEARAVLALAIGDVVTLTTKVGAPGALNVGAKTIAVGTCGLAGSQLAFRVSDAGVAR
jgi:flagellar motor switch/type III secretory pathway protein FliN